jgi:hypothetical protein
MIAASFSMSSIGSKGSKWQLSGVRHNRTSDGLLWMRAVA